MSFDVPQDAGLRYVEVNSLALNITQFYAADLPYTALDMGLSSVLFGACFLVRDWRDVVLSRFFS